MELTLQEENMIKIHTKVAKLLNGTSLSHIHIYCIYLINQVNYDLHRCEITSREYCNFMKGYFHEEATLCSQVSKHL